MLAGIIIMAARMPPKSNHFFHTWIYNSVVRKASKDSVDTVPKIARATILAINSAKRANEERVAREHAFRAKILQHEAH